MSRERRKAWEAAHGALHDRDVPTPIRAAQHGFIRQIRELVLRRDGPACCWCGVETVPASHVETPATRTLEHLIPRSLGGSTNLPNLRIACKACNSARPAHCADLSKLRIP